MERLHKFIASCGVASRRAAEQLIVEGRVSVNGESVTQLGTKIDPEQDRVEVDGLTLKEPARFTVLLNKPKGVVTTLNDPQRRPTVKRYLPDVGSPLKPIGRLDMDSEGLILCTNDGELHGRVGHPRHNIEKEYRVIVRGDVTDRDVEKLRKGILIEGKKTAEAQVYKESYEARRDTTLLKMILHEGRNRQIRLMCAAIGHPVQSLKRVRIGFLTDRGLPVGQCRALGKPELERLRAMVGLGALPTKKSQSKRKRVEPVEETE